MAIDDTREMSDEIGSEMKTATDKLTKKAGDSAKNMVRKGSNAIKNKAKEAIKKAAIKAAQAIIKVLIAAWPIVLAAIGIIVAVVIMTALIYNMNYSDKVDEQAYANELVERANRKMANVLSAAFYTKYSDQSYYFTLSEPDEADKNQEINQYSGKTYEELNGEANRGLTQASYINYIKDIDGYEENVKLTSGMLSTLDKYLNNAGEPDGYYYPEQFIKALYVGDSCDLNSEDLDIKTCELGNLDEAESVAYEKMNTSDDFYTENDAVMQEGTSDYGLGALVHYQAYYQPSRVFNYKINTVSYVDQDWEYGDSDSPLKTGIQWSSLDKETKDQILSEYKYKSNIFSESTGKGMLDTGETGIYNVDNEIVYKDWAAAYYADEPSKTANDPSTMYANLEWEKWASSDPLISTGILDTSVVYAIDNALTYFGDNKISVTQKWTDIGETTHTQTGTYLKDYESDEATVQNEWAIKSPSNVLETLKRLYVDGEKKGYMISAPFWISGTYEGETEEVDVYGEIDNDDFYCSNYTDPALKAKCLKGTHQGKVGTKTNYYMKVNGGSWEFHLTRNVDGNPTDETITVKVSDTPRELCSDSSCNSFKNKYSVDNHKEETQWRYEPSFVFKIGAVTKGDLQVNLVSHTGNSIQTENGVTSFLKDYFRTYTSYIAHSSNQFGCYTTTSTMPNDALPSSTMTSSGYSYGLCKEDEFALALSANGYMKTMGVDGMSDIQKEALKYIFGITEENYGDEENVVEFGNDSLTVSTQMPREISEKISIINTKYSKLINKYSGMYGVDKNLLVSLIYIADINDDSNITGVHCDKSLGCTLKSVKNFSDAIGMNADRTKKEDLIIGTTLTEEESIKFAAAKMQLLLEKYDGNVLLAIFEYNAGYEATQRLLKIYEAQEGYPIEATIDNKYETAWYHFVTEIFTNRSLYGIELNENAKENTLSLFLSSMSSNALIWNRMDDKGALSSVIWNKLFITDNLATTISKKVSDPQVVKALYTLRKNEGKSFIKYWPVITSGQKLWASSEYINEDGTYEPSRPYTADLIEPRLTNADIENTVKATLAFDGDVRFEDMDILSENYMVSKLGSITVEPNYKYVIGDITGVVAKKYETLQEVGYTNGIVGDSAYSQSWVLSIEEDLEVNSITKGTIYSTGTETVVVETEQGALVTYEGLKNIEVEAGDDADNIVLGLSKGKVSISVSLDGKIYDMKQFVDKYIEESRQSSLAFFNGFSSFLGCSALPPEETAALWRVIHETIYNGGMTGAYEYQCTMFTNYLATVHWGDAIRDKFGKIPNVNGNGNTKVDRLKQYLGDVLGSVTDSLPEEGSNLAFSWDNGEAGHTGWIDECKYDPSMEGNGYVIVSQGNIDYNGGISWQYKYTWDEWTSSYPQGAGKIKYVGLA